MTSLAPILLPLAAFAAALTLALALRAALARSANVPAGPAERLFTPRGKSRSLAAAVGALAQPRSEQRRRVIRRRLTQSGFEGKRAYELYAAVRATLALGLPALTWLALRPSSLLLSVALALMAAAVGYYAPTLFIENRRIRRQEALLKPFPNALDLLVSSVEAGLGLDAALDCVAREMEPAAPQQRACPEASRKQVV